MCFQISVFVFFGQIPTSRITCSIFSFVRNLHTAFHRGHNSLQPHLQCTRVPFSLHPHLYLLFVDFLIIAILSRRWGYLSVVLIYIFLLLVIPSIFLYVSLLTICMPPLGKCLMSSAHFSTALFTYLLHSCRGFLHVFYINLLADTLFAYVFPLSRLSFCCV